MLARHQFIKLTGHTMINTTIERNHQVSRILMIVFLIALGTPSAPAQSKRKKSKYVVPVDTSIRLRMNNKLSSKNAQVGNQFTSTVVTPVYVRGVEVIPAGSIVTGHVTHVDRAGRKSEAGSLDVTFTSIKIPNGVNHSINGSLVGPDGTDNEADIKGKSSKKRNAKFIGRGMVVGGLINGGAGVVTGGLFGAARGLIKKGEEAQVDSGTEFDMVLNRSVSLSAFR
jgi:hypothetical protein